MKTVFTDEAALEIVRILIHGIHTSGHLLFLTQLLNRFSEQFSMTVWYNLFGKQFIGPHVLEELLTSERYRRFLERKLSLSLDVPVTSGEKCSCSKMTNAFILLCR